MKKKLLFTSYSINNKQKKIQQCCYNGCNQEGKFKAPKNKDLTEYLFYCYKHIIDFNQKWDFCANMSAQEIENRIRKDVCWDRPTWNFNIEKNILYKIYKDFSSNYKFNNNYKYNNDNQENRANYHNNIVVRKAMRIMGLSFNIDMAKLKARYHHLLKKYHPDLNKNNDKYTDAKLKSIIVAYKQIYEYLKTKK